MKKSVSLSIINSNQMRTILFCLLSLAISPLVAQNAFSDSKSPTDTLWPGNASSASTYELLADTNGGYVLGTNSYNSIAIGQQFHVSAGYIVEGAFYWFPYKKAISNDSISFTLWNMDSLQGYTMAGDNQPCPGTVLSTYKTTTQLVDTSSELDGAFKVTFAEPIAVYSDYIIGFDMSKFTNDSIGIMSTTNGSGNGYELVWEQWGINHSWHTIQASGWNFPALLDIDAMILPIVDMSSAGITETPEINGLRCSLWPNPAAETLHLSISSLVPTDNYNIQILDIQSKLISTISVASTKAQVQTIDIPVNQLPSGSYYCIVTSSMGRIAMKLQIAK